MKKSLVIGMIFLFIQCLGVKNKNNTGNFGFLALLTGGTITSNATPSQNGNPTSGTGNGTSNSASADIKSTTGGTLSLGSEMSLTVSAESIESDSTLTVKKVAVANTDSTLVPIQTGYEFGPENLNFSEPATLKVCYNPDFLKSKNLSEKAVQIFYFDPDTKEMASVGGTVDLVAHCVTAQVEHFSTYIPAVTTSTVLTISATTVTPARPIVGMPLKLKTKITPTATSPLASAFISYRIKGSSAAFTKVPLLQDSTDTTALSFYTILPASVVTLAGIEYFLEATDEANTAKRLPIKGVSSRLITRTLNPTTPLRYNVTKPILISSGAYRNLALQVQDTSGLWQTTFSETNDLQGNMGNLSYIGNTIRFTAGQVGAGTITSSYGGYSTSLGITVKAGKLAKVEILDVPGAIITAPVNIIKGQTFGFKALGYDNFGNSIVVKPVFTVTGGIGTYNKLTGIFIAVSTPNISGTLTAKVGTTVIDSVDINVIPNSYPISGVVTGIPSGKSLVLQNNGTDDLTLANDGGFSFATNVFTGASYSVTILSQTPGVNCTLASGSGTVATTAVTNVVVSCEKVPVMLVDNIVSEQQFFKFNNSLFQVQAVWSMQRLSNILNLLDQSKPAIINNLDRQFFPNPAVATELDDGIYFKGNRLSDTVRFDGVNLSPVFSNELTLNSDYNCVTLNGSSYGASDNYIVNLNDAYYILSACYSYLDQTNYLKILKITNNVPIELFSKPYNNNGGRNNSLFKLNNEIFYFTLNETDDKIKVLKILPNDQLIEVNSPLSNINFDFNLTQERFVDIKLFGNKLWFLLSTDKQVPINNYNRKIQLWSFDGNIWKQTITQESSLDFYFSFNESHRDWLVDNDDFYILQRNRLVYNGSGTTAALLKYSNNAWAQIINLENSWDQCLSLFYINGNFYYNISNKLYKY